MYGTPSWMAVPHQKVAQSVCFRGKITVLFGITQVRTPKTPTADLFFQTWPKMGPVGFHWVRVFITEGSNFGFVEAVSGQKKGW